MVSRTQNQITNSWNETETIAVSVVCTTYNHELYIREALEGFLKQETTFPFEIIIHDDASTDNTAEIIREYVSKYPEIIRPVFQSENQYSKGGFKPLVYASGFAKGIYIALCEGDDYWIAPDKLQTQVDILEKHPEMDFSFHAALIRNGSATSDTRRWGYGKDRIFSLDEVIASRGAAPTCSYCFRRKSIMNLPDWFFSDAPVGDYYLEIFGSQRGGAIYTAKAMSVYRVNGIESWTVKTGRNLEAFEKHHAAFLKTVPLLANHLNCSEDIFTPEIALKNVNLAFKYLAAKEFLKFREYIEVSVKQAGYLSQRQRVAYQLRRAPGFLLLAMQVKSTLKKL